MPSSKRTTKACALLVLATQWLALGASARTEHDSIGVLQRTPITAMARARNGLATRTDSRVLAVSLYGPTLICLEHATKRHRCSDRRRGLREITDLSSFPQKYRRYQDCTKIASEPKKAASVHDLTEKNLTRK